MTAPTEVYVDPSINANSGSGTIGSPYGDFQYALNTVTRDSTNGNRFNVKAGTAEVLTGIISLATYGTPTADAPLIVEGYTSAAGDGGIGDFNGNNGNFTIVPSNNFQIYKNMKLRNTGSAAIVTAGLNWATFDAVEFNTCTAGVVMSFGAGMRAIGCSFTGFSTTNQVIFGLNDRGTVIFGCWLEVLGTGMHGIRFGLADSGLCSRNIVNCSGSATGISVNNVRGGVIAHNSILSASGTGTGILLSSSGSDGAHVFNNIVAGFSGSGGKGLSIGSGSRAGLYGYNYYYSNATDEDGVSGNALEVLGGNELAAASDPYAKSGSNTFANRFLYFAPLNVGSLWGGTYPAGSNLDKGAVQHATVAGGGGNVFGSPIVRGGVF